MTHFKETIIIAMGGSLLIPNDIDVDFIKDLKHLVKELTSLEYQVVLVIGGGKVCRNYQAAARNFENVTDLDLDWIGIRTIRLNCELIIRAFSDLDIHDTVIEKPSDIRGLRESVIVVGAWEPGCSSDTDAVEMAKESGAQRIINFSNTPYIYSADPRKFKDAVRYEKLSWDEYRNIIPKEWSPGMSAPFDPVASEMAQSHGMTVAVLGASLENLQNYLSDKTFEGTIIS